MSNWGQDINQTIYLDLISTIIDLNNLNTKKVEFIVSFLLYSTISLWKLGGKNFF